MFMGLFALAGAGGMLGANGYFQRLAETENGQPPSKQPPPNQSASGWPPAEHVPPAIGDEQNWLSAYPSDDFGPPKKRPITMNPHAAIFRIALSRSKWPKRMIRRDDPPRRTSRFSKASRGRCPCRIRPPRSPSLSPRIG